MIQQMPSDWSTVNCNGYKNSYITPEQKNENIQTKGLQTEDSI